MGRWWPAVLLPVLFSLGAWLGGGWLRRLPFPNETERAQPFDPDSLALSAGGPRGSRVPTPLEGVVKAGFDARLLRNATTRLFEGRVQGAESVAVVPESGDLVLLDRYGYLHRASATPDGYALQENRTYLGPGRPLGFHVSGDDVTICDSLKGLTRFDGRALHVLANTVVLPDGVEAALQYANDLDVSQETGAVFFTTSASTLGVGLNAAGFYDTYRAYLANLLQGANEGRLARWDPASRRAHVLLDGLAFANGVALAEDDSFVLVAETNHLRVLRLWLRGPREGEVEVFAEKLPGLPDGVSRSQGDPTTFWVPLISPAAPLRTRLLAPLPPTLRAALAHLFDTWPALYRHICAYFHGQSCSWGAVLRLGPDGAIIEALWDAPPATDVSSITAVTEHNGRLFFGNLKGDSVSYFDLERRGGAVAA